VVRCVGLVCWFVESPQPPTQPCHPNPRCSAGEEHAVEDHRKYSRTYRRPSLILAIPQHTPSRVIPNPPLSRRGEGKSAFEAIAHTHQSATLPCHAVHLISAITPATHPPAGHYERLDFLFFGKSHLLKTTRLDTKKIAFLANLAILRGEVARGARFYPRSLGRLSTAEGANEPRRATQARNPLQSIRVATSRTARDSLRFPFTQPPLIRPRPEATGQPIAQH